MRLATNNVIEASDAAGGGMDLRAWASGTFNPGSANANFNYIVDSSLSYDVFGNPDFLYVEFSNGMSLGLLIEAGYDGLYGTSEATFLPGFDAPIAFFVGYGLSKSSSALFSSVEDHQFYISYDELAAIESGWLAPPLSYFSLAGHDEILGNGYRDHLVGAGGDDIVSGGGGGDRLWGGTGDDTVLGGAGNDRAKGDADDDTVRGGGGDDTLFGGAGSDRITGDGGADIARGASGNDTLIGGASSDRLFGGSGQDVARGGGGGDRLVGGGGNDLLAGSGGRDILIGGKGYDTLIGGGGADRFVFAPRGLTDVVKDFRNGQDKLDVNGVGRFGALDIDERNGDAVISYRGTTIVLDGVDADLVDASDFLF